MPTEAFSNCFSLAVSSQFCTSFFGREPSDLRPTAPLRTIDGLLGARSGQRMFERDEITGALEDRGLKDVRQRISGLAQFVGGRLP